MPDTPRRSVVDSALGPLLAVVVVGLTLRQAGRPVSDPDTFWHLRLGDLLVAQRSTATPDWQTQDQRAWVPTAWLTDVVMSTAQRWFGLPGVMWLFGAGLVALFLLMYAVGRSQAGRLAAAAATALGVLAASGSLSPRPHLVSYLLLTITLGVWLRRIGQAEESAPPRPPWLLIPLTWVWAMCHGMWFTGPLLGVAVVLGLILDRRVTVTAAARLLAVPLASVVAAALTPVGPALLLAPVNVGGIGVFITEWQPPSFREPGPAAGALLLLLVVVTWARTRDRVPWTRIVLLTLAAGWMVLAVRTVALGAVLATPLAAAAMQQWIGRAPEPSTRGERRFAASTGLVALLALAFVVPHTSRLPATVPSALSPALERLPAGTPVLNDYVLGGWLRWAHPELDPLVDGLTEAYTVDELRAYARMTAVAESWEEAVAGTATDAALLPIQAPLTVALVDRLGWCRGDTDAGYALLRRPGVDGCPAQPLHEAP